MPDGLVPVAPLPVKPAGGMKDFIEPRGLSDHETEGTIADHATAARNAMAAGFDATFLRRVKKLGELEPAYLHLSTTRRWNEVSAWAYRSVHDRGRLDLDEDIRLEQDLDADQRGRGHR
jgi:hypothetical protein